MIRLKITSILLSVVMCVTMAFPSICVMADEAAEPTETQTEATEKLTETKAPEKKQSTKAPEKKQEPKETEEKEEPKETTKQEPKETEKKEEPKETVKQEPKETEKQEQTETEKQEPTEPKKEEPTEPEKEEPTEPKKEEPTEPEKEEPTESKKEDPTETEKQEPTEPKQVDPTEPEKQEPEESGSNEEPEETTDEAVTETVPNKSVTKVPKNNTSSLGTISNVEINNGILTWDSVEGAEKYRINVSSILTDLVENTSYNLDSNLNNSDVNPDTYWIELFAVDKDSNDLAVWRGWYDYKSSSSSGSIESFTGVSVSSGILWWGKINAASYYWVVVDGNKQKLEKHSFNIDVYIDSLIVDKVISNCDSYPVELFAFNEEDEKIAYYRFWYDYISSANPSTSVSFQNIKIENGTMTWDALPDAVYYDLYIDNDNHVGRITGCEIDLYREITRLLGSALKKKDSYSIILYAYKIGDEKIGVYKTNCSFNPGDAYIIKNINANSHYLTWDAFEGAKYYYIYIYNQGCYCEKTLCEIKKEIDSLVSSGIIEKKDSYPISIRAYDNEDLQIAYSESTYSYIPSNNVSEATVSGIVNKTYTGSAITQGVVVTLDGMTLNENTDYSVSYTDNVNAGTAKVTITGKGNYTGNIIKNFKINPADLSGATVTGIVSKTYTGSAITQELVVTLNGLSLIYNTDYTVKYWSNINVGTAQLTVTGKGNYSGNITSMKFTINPAAISDVTIRKIEDKIYTGSEITQSPLLIYNNIQLSKATDYSVDYTNNTNVGTANMVFTGKGNFTGTVSKTFNIAPLVISNATVTGIEDKTYTGSAISQEIVVTLNGMNLNENTDYSVSYTNNINAGLAKVIVTGKGNYTGTVSNSFNIAPVVLSDVSVTGIVDKTYTGSVIKQALIVAGNGKILKENTDYTFSYTDNINVGLARVTVTCKGNYTGTKSETFNIVKAANTLTVKGGKTAKVKYKKLKKKKQTVARAKMMSISGAQGKLKFKIVSVNKKKGSFKINANTGAVTVKKKLKKGTYTLKVSVTAEGNGNYNKLTKNVTFKIKVK